VWETKAKIIKGQAEAKGHWQGLNNCSGSALNAQ